MRPLSVTAFLSGINTVLAGVPALVEGEVSGYGVSQAKWVFFSLKDATSVVGCFMPVWKLKHQIEDGMLVRVAGVPSVYVKSGKFSITVEALEPAGDGSLKRAIELLKQKLEREGLFAPERKRSLPRFPERIGLIASGGSAAYSDFLRIVRNRWGGVEVVHCDVSVQGEGAVGEIVQAFLSLRGVHARGSLVGLGTGSAISINNVDGIATPSRTRSRNDTALVDLIVLTRGGGSLEDLMAFNGEEIARAIFASPVPVVVGVGHERDITIADLVADVRASTPSNAAERVVPDRRDVANEIAAMEDAWASQLQVTIGRRRAAIERFFARGGTFAQARAARVAAAAERIMTSFARWRGIRAERVEAAARLLGNLNPTRVLQRGYSLTRVGGRIVRDATQIAEGAALTTQFARGRVVSTVTDVNEA